jgi:hypothetical protein
MAMLQATLDNSTRHEIDISKDEALFLRCILQCLNDYGIKPPAELGLPRSIGVLVDYDYVKRMMFTKMLRDDANSSEGLANHREQTRQALKAARTRSMAMGVLGSTDPFIWFTGKPIRGIKETPFAAFASSDTSESEPVILRPVEHGFTDDGRPVTRCIVVSGRAEAALHPRQNG